MEISESRGWFYLTGQGVDSVQHHGPFSVPVMKELFDNNYVTEDALVWAEGEKEWLPLKVVHQLYSEISSTGMATPMQRNKAKLKKARKQSGADDPTIAQLHAEIAAAEESEALASGEQEEPVEREFVDDDGTHFVWDSALQRYKPQGGPHNLLHEGGAVGLAAVDASAGQAMPLEQAQHVPEYDPEEMRFVPNDEQLPSLEEALAEDERIRALAQGLDVDEEPPVEGSVRSTGLPGDSESGSSGIHKLSETQREDSMSTSRLSAEPRAKRPRGSVTEFEPPEADAKAKGARSSTSSVYVTGLPDGVTVAEVAEEFKRCGIIKADEEGMPRVRLYRDQMTGMLKGDALVTFLQRPSVNLAITLMDGRPFRPTGTGRMTVQEATFQSKAADHQPSQKSAAKGGFARGATKAGAKKKGPGRKQADRLLGWAGYDDMHKVSEVTVLAAGLFTVDEMTLSPDLETEISDYLVSRCKDLGAIDKVKVYRTSPAGVCTIKFRVPEAAQAAVERLQCTVKLRHLFPDLASALDGTLVTEVAEDVAIKCAEIGAGPMLDRMVEGGATRVLRCSAHGGVVVAFTEDAAARICAAAFKGLTYDGRALDACVLHAELWDGKTPPALFGQEEPGSDQERIEAFARDLEA